MTTFRGPLIAAIETSSPYGFSAADTLDILVVDGGSISVTAGKDIEAHVWVQPLQNT